MIIIIMETLFNGYLAYIYILYNCKSDLYKVKSLIIYTNNKDNMIMTVQCLNSYSSGFIYSLFQQQNI